MVESAEMLLLTDQRSLDGGHSQLLRRKQALDRVECLLLACQRIFDGGEIRLDLLEGAKALLQLPKPITHVRKIGIDAVELRQHRCVGAAGICGPRYR